MNTIAELAQIISELISESRVNGQTNLGIIENKQRYGLVPL